MEDYEITKVGDEYLVHSLKGTARKVHKYISRTYKKGRWYYEYPITGKGYLKKADEGLSDYDKWKTKYNHSNRTPDNDNIRRQVIRQQEKVHAGQKMYDSLDKAYTSLDNFTSKSLAGKIDKLLKKKIPKARDSVMFMELSQKSLNDYDEYDLKTKRDTLKDEQEAAKRKEAPKKALKSWGQKVSDTLNKKIGDLFKK